ncbi:MAG: FHA domain-containing protein [Actinobacteria bacterium]|nr:FHA domain-containing protein [Actinomycetota bacterium]MCB9411523.1 FHA domain-containing protein [Actinomycetota bacterium]
MSELALTLLRLGFLFLLWVFVFLVVSALRRDLAAPSSSPVAGLAVAGQGGPRTSRRKAKQTASKLVVIEGNLSGTVIPLGSSPVTMGRAADCTLVLDDDYASSHHCRLYPHENAWVVEDLGSTNGTWIDRTRVTGPTVLAMGQPLRIGRTVVELRT